MSDLRVKTSTGLVAILDAALDAAGPAVRPMVRRLREKNPDATPEELLRKLDAYFTSTVAASGAATGAAAAVPGAGTVAAIGLATGDSGVFLTTAATYVLAVAEVHGYEFSDLEARRALVMASVMGSGGAATVQKIAGRTGSHWGRALANAVPLTTIRNINRVLGRNFVTRYGTRTGILVLGKAAPLGLGAVLGAGGNALLARATIKTTRKAFGPVEVSRSRY